jgi:hypothetical protein
MHRALPCSKGMLGSMVLDECSPPSSSAIVASFSGGKRRWFLHEMTI